MSTATIVLFAFIAGHFTGAITHHFDLKRKKRERPGNFAALNLALMFEAKTGTPLRCYCHSSQGSRCALIDGHPGNHCWQYADLIARRPGWRPECPCGSPYKHVG